MKPIRAVAATFVTVLTVTGLVVAGPTATAGARSNGNALDTAKYHGAGTYQLSVTSYESALKRFVGRSDVSYISFATLMGRTPTAMTSCGSACRRWPGTLNSSARAVPQGLAGSKESTWSAVSSKAEILASSWYTKSASGATNGSNVKFVNTSNWKFRTVPLRFFSGTGTTALAIHAGGAAWAGRYLYIAATYQLYRFDLTQITKTSAGVILLPDRRYTALNIDPYKSPDDPRLTLSSISTDWSGTPALVTAHYESADVTTEVVRWPIASDGALMSTSGRVRSAYNFWVDKDSSIDNIQGVESHNGTYIFANSGAHGDLDRARVGTQTGRATFSWYGSSGPEDLYAATGGRVYGNTEKANARYVFWRSFSSVFG